MLHQAYTQDSRFCRYCHRRTLCEMQGAHPVHGVLLVLTCGLSLPFLLWRMLRPRFRCKRCGGHT